MPTTASIEKRTRRNKRPAPAEQPNGSISQKAASSKKKKTTIVTGSTRLSEKLEVAEVEDDDASALAVKNQPTTKKDESAEKVQAEQDPIDNEEEEEEEEDDQDEDLGNKSRSPQIRKAIPKRNAGDDVAEYSFVGDPVPVDEAKRSWPHRYPQKGGRCVGSISNGSISRIGDDEMKAKNHYSKCSVDKIQYCLYDDVYVQAVEGEDDYIGRIVELFEGTDRQPYFTAQWFFRAKDTVIKDHAASHEPRRVFLSEEKNDNMLDCIVSKIKIVRVKPNTDLTVKEGTIPECDLYYDMSYSLSYSTFANLPPENESGGSEVLSTVSEEDSNDDSICNFASKNLSLLDLYSGCGAMSTGLCLGANMARLNLETRWAVDLNEYACESLKLNHPQTEVRNEKAEHFLSLIKEWEALCGKFSLIGSEILDSSGPHADDQEPEDLSDVSPGDFEVEKLLDICYGDPQKSGDIGLKFKVKWKGYGPEYDSWEPSDGLSECQESIEDFVRSGYKRKILPLPGDADVICGGPPCQGASGFNRFRNTTDPLSDTKNQQMMVFMEIVEFLKPKYVLMENVVDILKFAKGYLGRYALSRLVAMNYQARLGIMAAGCYGLPQFRLRCFLWGAQPTQKLPQFALPTHDVVVRGGTPNEFEQNVVAYNENQRPQLQRALLLADAISDLPPVQNDEHRDEMPYGKSPKTEFQHFIRLNRHESIHASDGEKSLREGKLFDHKPYQCNQDDFMRVCRIPKKKGANFRDLPGVIVGANNIVEWDPNIERVLLPSGKPLVPDYAMSFIKGKSPKPFGRLWWDETVPTVVTRPEPHNQIILHPEQDRVLSIRENARLQGFPDYYKLCGPVKERYIQVGNAVAVPVSRALGYGLGLAFQGRCNDEPLFTLPPKFPCHSAIQEPGSASDLSEPIK